MSEQEPTYSAYANASVTAIINADSPEQAEQAFCSPNNTYIIPLESGVEAKIEIDKGIDIEEAEGVSTPSTETIPSELTDHETGERIDPNAVNPDIGDVTDIISSHLPDDEFSISKLNGVISLQLHNNEKTDDIAAELTRSDYSFDISQVFECPPKFKIWKQVNPP